MNANEILFRPRAPRPVSGRGNGLGEGKAFTLIELLVVISVIGVLVGLLLPSLSGARAQSRRLSCLTNLKGFGMAFELYRKDNKDLLPYVLPFYDIGQQGAPGPANDPQLLDVLEGYMDVPAPTNDRDSNGRLLRMYAPYLCPSDRDEDSGWSTGLSYQYWAGGLMLMRETFRAESPRTVAATVTKFYEYNPDFAVMVDAKPWHQGRKPTASTAVGYYDQNALYFGDWRADWLKLDPQDAVRQQRP